MPHQSIARIAAAVLILATTRAALAQSDPAELKTVLVTGSAEVEVAPDEVVFHLVIETEDKNLDSARQRNEKELDEVMNVTRQMHIAGEFVQTGYLDIDPDYLDKGSEYTPFSQKSGANSKKPELVGYVARRRVVIRLRDVAQYTDCVARLLKTGAELDETPDFRVLTYDDRRAEARLKALRRAKEKAVAMAGELGMKVGKPLTITEGVSDRDQSGSDDGRRSSQMSELYSMYAARYVSAPKNIVIRSVVSVEFELE